MDLSTQNYSFELLKRGAESALDVILDDPDNMNGFDRSDDSWSGEEELLVEFYNSSVLLNINIELEVNEGAFEEGEIDVHKAELMDSSSNFTLLNQSELDKLSFYLSW